MILSKLTNQQTGNISEHLVKYKLLSWGYNPIFMDGFSAYDIFVDADIPVRVQVKGTAREVTKERSSYQFTAVQSVKKVLYDKSQIDVFCFVSLERQRIFFDFCKKVRCRSIKAAMFTEEQEYASWLAVLDKLRKQ